ncbi:MAG: GH3 auxin-responsive promoter family protein [Muribaculum sp.]|nr:GH3 auxin-responsive promoter family protein [Muribaculaceae bacterium]MCM1081129.1 GH3 auxin-responsive promoter family protein [Muribaculum sp.]MCM1255887.1 GH3 auxin-responsive promoter family protein [Duncaniella sp.]
MITRLLTPLFDYRCRKWRTAAADIESSQRRQLSWLLSKGATTQVGERFHFNSISNYESYRHRAPVVKYEDIRQLVMTMVNGRRDVLWPGRVRRFAQSSGTSDGKSKYIPVTDDSLRLNHYRGGFDTVVHYLNNYRDSNIFSGKAFILGGSFANELDVPGNVFVGDLSANLIDNINPLVNFIRVPAKKVALMPNWAEKLPKLVEGAMNANVSNISGVPSWFLTVLKKILKEKGADSIHDVWPNLEVFFHGGISMEPYRTQYNRICDTKKMRYVETYNASEGFFGIQTDPESHWMEFIPDGAIFYEFVPLNQIDEPFPDAVPAWKVEPGQTYALVITAANGLWRYAIGDTVTIQQTNPLKFTIAGRTKHYINAFGEELMVYNAEHAMAATCRQLGCEVANYTAAPVYADDNTHGSHQWLIEFTHKPESMEEFARVLDEKLQNENSDYQAKRSGNIFLDPPVITVAPTGLFDNWLADTGKLGGQRKVPRLCPDRRYLDPMLELCLKI